MRWLLTAVTVCMLAGCGSGFKWFPTTDPNAPASVVVSATPPVAGSSDISATVNKPDGTPVADGTLVSFSATPAGASLSANTATTAGGVAFVTLTSVDPGTFTVNASAGNASGNAVVPFLAIVSVAAVPTAAAINTPVAITATVKKPDGVTNINDNTTVSFSTTQVGGTFTPSSQVTATGKAAVSFSSTAQATFTITATVGAATGTTTLTIQ